MQAVQQAHDELQAEKEELRRLHRDMFEDDTEYPSDMDDGEETFYDE